MNQQRAQHDRRRHVAGDTQRHQGNQRTALNGIVGTFRRDDAFRRAGAELVRFFGGFLRLVVSQDVGHRAASTWQDASEHADGRRAHHHDPSLGDFLERPSMFDLRLDRATLRQGLPCRYRVADIVQQLGKGEQPDQHGNEIESREQRVEAEVEPCHADGLVFADGADQKPDRTGDQPLD